MPDNPLVRLLNPSSIATVGAGNNPLKMGTMHALSILKDGYEGTFYPVHPREETILGRRAYHSVADLPEAPDLAFLVVPAPEVARLLEEFGKKGTPSAIIITAGFGELGEEGRRMQKRLNDISAEYGIRFLGPNCMGIINSEISLNTTVMPYTGAPGSLGFASQSGTYVTQSIPYLGKKGIRFSKAISVGNSANIDITDALEYLGGDGQTKAISLYIEGLRDVPRFIDTARKITPHKPVLAQYVGGSGAGARSSLSHTGSMAAPDHLYEGLFRQAGIIRVNSIEELYHYGNMLAVQPPLRGKRIGVFTNSGGPGSAMANALERGGLEVPEFSKELQEAMRPLMPPHAPSGNPVDMTFSMDVEVLSSRLPEMVIESGEVDGVVIHGVMRSGYVKSYYEHIQDFLNGAPVEALLAGMPDTTEKNISIMRYGKPVAISSFFDRDDDYMAAYEDNGIPVFDSPEKTAGAMVAMHRHREIRERKPYAPVPVPVPPAEALRLVAEARERGQGNLDEHGSKLFLKSWGLPVTDEIIVSSEEEAAAAADRAGYPLVLKASAADILHKTGKGLIYLNLKSRDEAVASFRKIREAAGAPVPVIAYRMVEGDRELVAGVVRAPGFGPSVMFGLGGIFTEALGDMVFRPAPLSLADAEEMIHDIRSVKLLGPFRGMAEVNRGSLALLLHRLSLIPLAHPEIAEIDVNPVIIEGPEPVAVDALVVFAD
ncbi:MAG TPA: acetate--CoA ligase family protein [Spirochaetota bacterium]|nr:acetate--CoA ligase family protein [Spirochaetota bacterium]HPL18672.1 acetate--CoA ligase family protein [Spirochaetota bacterium]HQF07720.1 acetate--CoA ligase family protein [Spirochaetota bacterium]HQH99309.1 acetate--CoA ligase family protein [Spirochaetota bacterium]HQJ73054.1 acetate--CoA ligase family protein [Spirochaetota bacterium]